jgi:predicted dienelactone hydrolase
MLSRSYIDGTRASWDGKGRRPLLTRVWYPAAPGGRQSDILGPGTPFAVPRVVQDAKLSSRSRTYPLVLLSHGTGGSALQMMWLGHHLAAHGYIVAAINHHGNTGIEPPTPQGFLLVWERARDMRVLLDRLLADSTFGTRIDRPRIGAAGFSLGGYTVIALAGGRFSPKQFERFCHSPEQDFTCEPQPEFPQARAQFEELRKMDPAIEASLRHAEDSYRDPRVKAVFAIAPALGGGLTRDSLGEITVPVQIVVGDGDTVAPPATNAALLASLIPKARLTTMPGVGHYTFLADCNSQGRSTLPICRDALGVERAETHAWANRLAVAFFESAW